MSKKKKIATTLATILLAYVAIMPTNGGSLWWIGEPQLPKKMLKEEDQLV